MKSRIAGVTAHRTFGISAAMLTVLAGAPAGYAQQSGGEGGAFSSLKEMIAGGARDQQARPGTPSEPGAQAESQAQDFRTDGVYYDENMTVELHVQDESLVNVLQMLSIQSERNIVASKDVSANVTANLYGVTFHEALDAILHVNGYGYIERGNFIYVYPLDEIIAIEQASRVVESRVIQLSFLSAVDAADFCSPLLSEEGEIKSNGKAAAWSDPKSPTGAEDFANASTLVVYDFPENIDAIERLLAQIDTRPAQILVEATIVQTSLNEANAFGVDFQIIANLDLDEFASPLSGFDGLFNGGSSSSPIPSDDGGTVFTGTPGGTSGPGTFKAGIVSNDVAVFVRALQEVTDTTIISNPKVVTLNRQPGRVLVGRKVGYLSTTSTETSTTQTVEFLDTGTQLNFRPFVTSEGLIRLELKPQVSEAQLRTSTDATGAAVTIPDEVTNELIANVLVPDGHTVVLGGLFREATTATRRQVPILGDIPLIGTAFRGHDDEVNRQEIIFMITPSVVSDQVLVDAGIRGQEAAQRVRAGAREGLLVFSRERQASQLLVEAEQLAAAGETDKALHKIRRCLWLHPFQPGAIELRERLLNERDIWPSRSLLETIIMTDAEERIEHNIHDRNWFGLGLSSTDSAGEDDGTAVADAPPSKPARSAAQNTGRQANANVKSDRATRPVTTASAEPTAESKPGGRLMKDSPSRRTGGRLMKDAPRKGITAGLKPTDKGWWMSPEFQAFLTSFAWFSAEEQGHRPVDAKDQWWNHPHFFAFMSGLEQAMAQDRGDLPRGPLDAWWEHPSFVAFVDAYEQGVAQESGETKYGALNAWWTHPNFVAFVDAFEQGRAQESGATPFGPLDAWWETPEFRAFTQAYDDAVESERATASGGSDESYTEVQTNNDD